MADIKNLKCKWKGGRYIFPCAWMLFLVVWMHSGWEKMRVKRLWNFVHCAGPSWRSPRGVKWSFFCKNMSTYPSSATISNFTLTQNRGPSINLAIFQKEGKYSPRVIRNSNFGTCRPLGSAVNHLPHLSGFVDWFNYIVVQTRFGWLNSALKKLSQ